MKKIFVWYWMFTKRLLYRPSFIIILLMIPLVMFAAQKTMSEEKAVTSVAIYGTGQIASDVIKDLTENENTIKFVRYESGEEARNAVKNGKIDCAWIFDNDLEISIPEHCNNLFDKPFITVVEREENVVIRLAREKLYGALFPYFSEQIFENYVREELPNISQAILEKYYAHENRSGSILEIEKLNDEIVSDADGDYLTAPLRGLMVLLIVLSGLAAAMYFLDDTEKGRYLWMTQYSRIIPAFGSCLASTMLSAITVLFALKISGNYISAKAELPSMILLVFATTGFCLLLTQLFRKTVHLGAFIPCIMLTMLVACPIIYYLKNIKILSVLFPPYYYLFSVYDSQYLYNMVLYCVVAYGLSFLLNYIKAKHSA